MAMPLSAARKTFSQSSVFSDRISFSRSIRDLWVAAASSVWAVSPLFSVLLSPFAPQAARDSTISVASSSAVIFFSFMLIPPCFLQC